MSRKIKPYMTEQEWRWIFSNNLLKLLERNEMSQNSFAAYMNVTPAMVSRWVNVLATPKISTRLNMCSILDCEFSGLIC